MNTSVLPSRGWKINTGSNETGGKQIYQITLDNETAYAYHDKHGADQIYGIQIISNKLYPINFFMTCQHDYTPDMCSGTETEIRELTNAFRVYYGITLRKGDIFSDDRMQMFDMMYATQNFWK